MAELERKLEPLSEITTLGKDTDAHLRTLNALAEHVAAKVKALETQQSVVEHALLESRRVHEMVWEMEVQLKKLDEGRKRVAHVEAMLADLERMQAEANKSLEETSRARETFGREAAQHERGARMLMDAVQGHIDQPPSQTGSRNRPRTAQGRSERHCSGRDTNRRRDGTGAGCGPARGAHQGVGESLEDLTASADSLQQKQASLSALEERLAGVAEMAKRTEWQFAGLSEQRKDLETLKTEIQAVHSTYEQAATPVDKLRANKGNLEASLDKTSSFIGQASAVETRSTPWRPGLSRQKPAPRRHRVSPTPSANFQAGWRSSNPERRSSRSWSDG